MSNLLNQVTPLTRGIIWLTKNNLFETNAHYLDIDYLLNGLLTANLNYSVDFTSKLIIGQNFKTPLYVMIIREVKGQEIQSFITLIKKDLNPGNDIVVIDEDNFLEKIKNELKEITSYLKSLN